MVKHTQEFIEKHERLLKEREELKLQKVAEREEKKKQSHYKKLKYNRSRYHNIKSEKPEKYEKYLIYMAEYRDAQRKKIKNEREKKIKYLIEEKGCVKVSFKKSVHPYYINEKAEIFNYTGKKVKASNVANGYHMIGGCLLHRVVWIAFNGKIPDGYEIDHIIPVKNGGTDELSNLRLATHKENCNNILSIENYKAHNKLVDRSYMKKNN